MAIATGAHAPMDKASKAQLVNLYFRLPQLLFLGFFYLLIFYLLKRLTGSLWTALFSSTFILLSPIIVGISQIINPDSLLWALGFAAILSYLIHLKEASKRFAFLAAFFLGACLLTKYTSVILIPFFLVAMLSYALEFHAQWGDDLPQKIKRYAWSFFIVSLGGLLLYAIALPDNLTSFSNFLKGSIGFKGAYIFFLAVFVVNSLLLCDAFFADSTFLKKTFRPLLHLQKIFKYFVPAAMLLIFGIIILDGAITHDAAGLFLIPFDASTKQFFAFGITWQLILRQFTPLVFSLSPLVLLLLMCAWVLSLGKKYDTQTNWLVFILSFFLLVFVSAVTQEKVPLSIRYSIMMYPVVFALAGLGLEKMLVMGKKSFIFQSLFFLLIVGIGVVSLWQIKPFYFNYTNMLLPQKYVIADGWGYGGYEIAQYLNALPGATNLRIWSDYNGLCVFFNGSCAENKLTMQNILDKNASTENGLPNFSYFISSRRGVNTSGDFWGNLKEEYGSKNIFTLTIGARPQNSLNIYINK